MKLSPAGLHLIASFEGFVPTPYNDAAGNSTIGYGHLLHAGGVTEADRQEWKDATPATLLSLLNTDAAYYALQVSRLVKVKLGVIPARAQARFDALCSFTFNVGVGAFEQSYLLRLINWKGAPRDWTSCGTAMLAWDHAGGVVVPGLLTRRKREAAILTSGRF